MEILSTVIMRENLQMLFMVLQNSVRLRSTTGDTKPKELGLFVASMMPEFDLEQSL